MKPSRAPLFPSCWHGLVNPSKENQRVTYRDIRVDADIEALGLIVFLTFRYANRIFELKFNWISTLEVCVGLLVVLRSVDNSRRFLLHRCPLGNKVIARRSDQVVVEVTLFVKIIANLDRSRKDQDQVSPRSWLS